MRRGSITFNIDWMNTNCKWTTYLKDKETLGNEVTKIFLLNFVGKLQIKKL